MSGGEFVRGWWVSIPGAFWVPKAQHRQLPLIDQNHPQRTASNATSVLLVEDRVLPCTRETWAAYQEMLLKMNPSNVDDIVAEFNRDSTWADASFIGEIAATVAGSRKTGAELVEFMTKISETRGYSALLKRLGEVEELMADRSLENEVANAITRGCQKSVDITKCHEVVVAEVRTLLDSDAFPVRAALRDLRPLIEAIADPLAVRRQRRVGRAAQGRARGAVSVLLRRGARMSATTTRYCRRQWKKRSGSSWG
jgi:hypothetical protein